MGVGQRLCNFGVHLEEVLLYPGVKQFLVLEVQVIVEGENYSRLATMGSS